MLKPEQLLCPKPEGLYCAPGGFYIDPVRPVDRAVITHGHADHARAGHGTVVATPETLDIMRVRYGEDFAGAQEPLAYGATVARDGVEVTLVPAGHVLGSAQAVVRWRGMTIVVSGDYKRRADPTCAPFEPIPCNVFVTEATFGLPVFRHPPIEHEIDKLVRSLHQFPERAHLVGAYALGKAQRVITALRRAGWDRTIYVHGALAKLNALYERWGIRLGDLAPATEEGRRVKGGELAGEVAVAPAGGGAGPLGAPFRRPGARLRVRLDDGARPRPAARRGAAAGDQRPRRLGRAHRHRRGAAPRRGVGHPRPRGGAGALVRAERRRRPRPAAWWATTTRRRSDARAAEPSRAGRRCGAMTEPDIQVPPEALAPSGRSADSLPATAPNPATRDPQADPEDGATELPPTPAA